jgi:hypothetical protein
MATFSLNDQLAAVMSFFEIMRTLPMTDSITFYKPQLVALIRFLFEQTSHLAATAPSAPSHVSPPPLHPSSGMPSKFAAPSDSSIPNKRSMNSAQSSSSANTGASKSSGCASFASVGPTPMETLVARLVMLFMKRSYLFK